MNDIRVFQNQQFGQVRTIEEDGKVLFCGNDVARALGYTNPRKALADHCKGVTKRDGVSLTTNQYGTTTKQKTEMNFIAEGDVYRLITHSKLPSAERFERWVFDEVLPSIRQSGGYAPDMSQLVAETVSRTLEQLLPKMMRWQSEQRYERKQPYTCLILTLPQEIQEEINDMLLIDRVGYVEISNYLKMHYDIDISKSSIARYALQLRGRIK